MKQKFITEEQFEEMYNYSVEMDINSLDSDEVLVTVYKNDNIRGQSLPVWSMVGDTKKVEQELKFRFNIVQYVNANKKYETKNIFNK